MSHQVLENFLRNCVSTEELFRGLAVPEENDRRAASKEIIKTVKSWIEELSQDESTCKLRATIGGLVRMANECPFEDVRSSFSDFLLELKKTLSIPEFYDPASKITCFHSPSAFVPPSRLASLSSGEDAERIMKESFLKKGRTSHLLRSMCYFPSYVDKFLKVYDYVFKEGPLPQTWINYLAIMASSRHHCEYLIINQQVDFYKNGGDFKWLLDIKNAPMKLRKLSTLNCLLAHQPWLLTEHHIKDLLKGEECWNISELVHAIAILVTFHALSGFIYGFGVTVEIDRRGENYSKQLFPILTQSEKSDSLEDANHCTSELLVKLKTVPVQYESDGSSSDVILPPEVIYRLFEDSGIKWTPLKENIKSLPKHFADFSMYRDGLEMFHTDFDVSSTKYKVFSVQDYSWEGQGFSLIETYCPGLGELLDSLFTETKNLTEYTLFDSKDVDTSPLRESIWYYVQRLKGLYNDDYDYSMIGHLLDPPIKKYIKKVCCFPELVNFTDYSNLGITLFDSEKVHINFIVMESRRQSELLYALKSLSSVV